MTDGSDQLKIGDVITIVDRGVRICVKGNPSLPLQEFIVKGFENGNVQLEIKPMKLKNLIYR